MPFLEVRGERTGKDFAMARAEIREKLNASREKLFETIIRYEDYPKFVEGCTKVEVERPAANRARVTYFVSMIKEISYTLDHVEEPEKGMMSWSLVKSDFIKKNNGRWELKELGPQETDTRYEIEIEFGIPVPSLILNRLIKSSLPSMVKSFEKRART